ncbi:MAG: lipopolysaccharide transport periplasmic protein LptA [Cycloclasticus sp.]|nr:lipopolysaccharide transport periplasmic protein LptA [Cycloclasticus sp. 46_83_sub15_T18]OUR84087.1 lipopolysaccharide transport periplasmic protein LptA [Cycloclasticus sp. 46_120_T64]
MKSNKLTITFIVLCLCSSPLWALSSDKNKPVEVEADSFNLDDAKKTTVYSGNVIITQGSMEISADKMTIYGASGATDKVIATGNPVKFKQQPDGQQGLIRGEARRFEYLVSKDTLVLINKATLWQAGTTFSSDRITYDSKRSIVKAGDKSSASKRVKITLQPSK